MAKADCHDGTHPELWIYGLDTVSSPAAVAKGAPINQSPPALRVKMKRLLKDGERLAFSILEDDGTKHLSHTIQMHRGIYIVTGQDDDDLGAFRTLHAAHASGFAASRDALGHGL